LASATVLGLWSSQANALSLGRIVVQSALGEPLRAEIEILEINDEEASTLRPRLALPDAFRASGMEYSAALNGLQISLQKHTDGRPYLRLSNSRPVNDPYVDLILEASWSTGRIVRDYTMLFDPPNLGAAQPVAPQAPQVSTVPVRITPAPEPEQAPTAAAPAAPAEAASAPAEPATPAAAAPQEPATAPAAAAPEPAAKPTPAAPVAAPKPAVAASQPPASAKRVTVKSGDTATKIAMANKPADVLLDQMLVAMLRSNPNAFIGGNVNRLRSGAVLNIPSGEQAETTTPDEARQILVAQSKDFDEFRRRLASAAPASAEAAADRKASGAVQAQVEEKKPAATAPDKLILSKGAVQAKTAEDKLAKERSAKEASARAEELSKNVAELEKLSKAAVPAAAPASAAKATAPAAAVAAAPASPAATASAPQAASVTAPAPAASAPVLAASAPAPRPAASAPVKRAPPPPPAPVEEPSLIDELLDNPLIPAAAGGLIAALAGYAFYRSRQRKNAAQVDSAYLESRLQPDSFFGASGGQRVDTNDAGASSSSSMVYSPSQLDAGDDVDPVAEADVYLAYGRDLQAEEILKEALRNHPTRVAIHQKLCEIYAKRRDSKNFGTTAKEAYRLTGGSGPEWEHICELGNGIDPSNAMYQPGGKPSAPAPLAADSAPTPAAVRQPAPAPAPAAAAAAAPVAAGAGVDLDLDLDFSLDEAQAQPRAVAPAASTMPAPIAAAPDNSLAFEAPSLPPLTAEPAPAASAPAAADNMMNFDLGGLSLDLGTPSEQPGAGSEDPLATKLALADEFKAIGDTDGARALIEEIIAEASGDMKARAQKALAALG
jgi:pilus assembly protein FimV